MIAPRHVTQSGTHYTKEGKGPALVFLHGAGGNAAVWFQQVEAFAHDHTVICVDLPGFGLSPKRETKWDPSLLGDVVLEVMDDAAIELASVIAQSLGGWFGLRAALAAPQKIDRLVLSCTMAGIAHAPAMTAFGAALEASGGAGVASLTLSDDFENTHPNQALLFRQISAFNPPIDMAKVGALFAPNALLPESDLAHIQCPVLIISGSDDPIWPPASLAGLAQTFTNGNHSIISETGHSPYFERPKHFNRLLRDFVSN